MWNYEEKGPDYEEDDYQGECQWLCEPNKL